MIILRYVILFFIALMNFAATSPLKKEFRATWVITWEYISSSQNASETMNRIDQIMDNHVAANMNAVFFQVRQSGTSYYLSSYEPWGYYAGYENPGFDPLQYAVNSAHSRGLEIHAWFNVFQASSTHEGTPSQEHPDWICRDRDGNPMTSSRSLSPGLEEVRQYTTNVAMEIVNNYNIDGLHLDYIRWNEYSSGSLQMLPEGQVEEINMIDGSIHPETLYQLENNRTGRYLYDVDHPYSDGVPGGFSSWEDWWRTSVTTFVSTLHDSIQEIKPYVRLSTAVLGRYNWGGWQGYGTVYQDGALWFNQGFVDQLTPMHYHWTTSNGFAQMLQGSNESWFPYLQEGASQGRLFSAGPGSYVLADQNLWENHTGIVHTLQNIEFVDGFQFFSSGTWEDYQYWQEAGHTFFQERAIISHIPEYESISDVTPSPDCVVTQVNELEYQLNITRNSQGIPLWTIVSLSPSDSINVLPSIYSTHFGAEDLLLPISFDGLQTYEGSYDISVENFNRFWIESENSAQSTTGFVPSFSPIITDINIDQNDTITANTVIRIEFSKEMNQESFEQSFSLLPSTEFTIEWSNLWQDEGKAVSIYFPELLAFDAEYTLEISGELTDIIGKYLDGNADGFSGDGISITFHTEPTDLTGPQISNIYPISNYIFDTEAVFNIMFDEVLDNTSINEASLQIQSGEQSLTVDHIEYTMDGKTTLSLKPFSPLVSNSTCTISIHNLSDTLGNTISQPLIFNYNTADFYYSNKTFLDRFNAGAGWWQPDGSGSTVGTLGSETQFNYSNSVFVPGVTMNSNGRKSGALQYAWDPNAPSSFLRLHNAGEPSNVVLDTSNIVQIYIYSDGSNNQITISLYEYIAGSLSDDVIEVMAWQELNWTGWKLIEWNLSESEQIGDWLSNDQTMDGDEYFLDGILLKPGGEGLMSGKIYFDDLRIISKSTGTPIENDPPQITTIPDTTIENGDNFYFFVNYTDNNDHDTHRIIVNTDTSAISTIIHGHTSGSVVSIDYEPYVGSTDIEVLVNDFGIGELSDTAYFSLTIGENLTSDIDIHPKNFVIKNTYPNPFNPTVTIDFDIDRQRTVSAHIFNIAGEKVKTLFENQNFNSGNHIKKWHARNDLGYKVSNGIYFIQFVSENILLQRKIIYVK
ncbi:MAG: hypothetical protein CBE24_07165 [bacterium TMED264]|nr:MAG: hypothetical protein CBE24_07165 [bacterium TMED264]